VCEDPNNPNNPAAGISGSVCVNHLWPVVAGGGGMKDEALKAAYLAGFNASGEGYNGEYPFEHKGKNCTDDTIWCKDRDNELAAIKQALAAPVQEPEITTKHKEN
jgi:hypothetical protein